MDIVPVRPAKPSWRKPAGIFLILLLIASWAWLVTTVAELLPGMPTPLRVLFFVAAGIVWILPLKPLLRWMETGEWREAIRSSDKAPPP
jgi:predicted membrane channel-forming protein YqfA (hemolysin III family)